MDGTRGSNDGIGKSFASMFTDGDRRSEILPDVCPDGPGILRHVFGRRISEGVLVSAFAYTVSRFTGHDHSVIVFIGGNGTGIPLMADCRDGTIRGFVERFHGTLSRLENSIRSVTDIPEEYRDADGPVFSSSKSRRSRNVDLQLSREESDAGTSVVLSYSGLHSSDTMRRFMESFAVIAESFDGSVNGGHQERKLSEIGYTSATDIEIQNRINATGHALRFADIIDAFKEYVISQPGRTLVTYLGRRYTYAEADRITDGIAYELSKNGIGAGDSVAVLVNRNEWYLLGALAVLKTGAAYVPIDESHPEERISFMVSDSSVKAMLYSDDSKDNVSVKGFAGTKINVDLCEEHAFDRAKVDGRCNAVLLYTSGTTGQPKASQISRLAILNLSEWYCANTGLGRDDVIALHTAYAFDMHTMALFPPMIVGASLDIVPEECRLDMDLLDRHFAEKGVTHTFITTQVGKVYASRRNPHIRVLYVAGEKLGEYPKVEGFRLYDGYGPSENLALSTSIRANDRCDPSSVGVPNHNVKAYILDREGRRVPIGAVGELFLSGYQLSNGYLNRGELNAAAFRDNPFVSDEERRDGYDRMYATGDFFRYLPDYTLGIIGRRDGQVKIRGNRVELTEVESAIRAMDGVRDVTVQAVANNAGGKELCAYVVASDTVDAESVREHVSERKPSYMVPSYVVFLDGIPLNVNGKVDKRALPKPDTSSSKEGYAAPGNDNERMFCEAFSEVFGSEKIGVDDDFFELGGDSLKAIMIQNATGIVTTVDILRYRTPRKIAQHCASVRKEDTDYSLDTGCPLTPSQNNVYLDSVSRRSVDAYLEGGEVTVPEGASYDDIRRAIDSLVDAHPILKGRIADRNGVPWMYFDQFPVIYRSGDVVGRIDLSEGPLCYFTIGADSVGFTGFHAVVDGISVEILKKDLLDALNGVPLARETEFLKMAAYHARTDGDADVRAFYDPLMSDSFVDSGLVPDTESGSTCSFRYESDIDVEKLIGTAKRFKVSVGSLLTSLFGYTLSRYSGRGNSVFCTVDNGRDRIDSVRAVGQFARTVPLCIDCSDTDVDAFVSRATDIILESMSKDTCSMDRMNRWYGINADVIFQYFAGLMGDYMKVNGSLDVSDVKTDLTVYSDIVDGRLVMLVTHSGRYSEGMVRGIVGTFDTVLSQIHRCGRMSEIELVSDDFRDVLDDINRTEREYIYDDVCKAFDISKKLHGESIAVRSADGAFTYADLDAISGGIASHLAESGLEKGSRVSVLTERGEKYLFAALATMRAGMAYVPLDGAYPDERLRFMAEDSDSRVILCDSRTSPRAAGIAESIGASVIDIDGCSRRGFDTRTCDPSDIATIIYTSGTTGVPKGSMLTRAGVANVCQFNVDFLGLAEDDVEGMYPSFGFCSHIDPMFAPLFVGACTDIIPSEARLDVDMLASYCSGHSVSVLKMPASMGRVFASSAEGTGLRAVIMGGEKLGRIDNVGGFRIVDGYGPTENTVQTSMVYYDRKTNIDSIGRPICNVKTYVLDDCMRRLPADAVGELWVAGVQVSPGYTDPSYDAKAFAKNPFSDDVRYGRMYNTGDYVRVLADGSIAFVGRRDGQVKIRGNRVETSEVASVIRSMPGVSEAYVTVAGGSRDPYICAYYVSDEKAEEHDVRTFVAERKPSYMVPAVVIRLDSMPHNVNGKIDRKALPEPGGFGSEREYTAPRNSAEEELCNAFASVLGIARVGIDDDFIRLGGDSLKAIRVQNISKVSTTADILRYLTPRAICEHRAVTEYDASVFTLETGCPLSESQLNVYLDIVAKGKTSAYVIAFRYDIPVGIDRSSAADAVSKVMAVHPILRSHVDRKDGMPWIVCDSEGLVFDRMVDVSDLDISRSLSVFGIVRGRIIGLISHIAFDGSSKSVLARTFDAVFAGKYADTDTGFLVSSAFDASVRDTDRYLKAKSFYDSRFCDADCDTGLVADIGGSDGTYGMRLSSSPDNIARFVSEHGISVGSFFISAFAYSLSRFTGRSDAVFCTVDNGRMLSVLEKSVGMFVRTVPLRIDCSHTDTGPFLADSSRTVLDSMSAAVYPFRLLHNEYGLDSGVIFQFMADVESSSLSDPDTIASGISYSAIGDLVADVREIDGSFVFEAIHSSKYSEDTVRRIAYAFDEVVKGLIGSVKLSDIKFTSADDIVRLDGINATERALRYGDVLDAFAENVSSHPERMLVRYAGREYSYAEADRITDGVAGELSAMGIGKGDRVAVLVPRGEWYMLGPLSVLKTGAAYVPVDDSYPDERIEHMLSDSSVKAILVVSGTEKRSVISDGRYAVVRADSCVGAVSIRREYSDSDDGVILYTSGSTGIPKGSAISRLAMLSFSEWYVNRFGFGKDDVYGMFSSFVFDAHIMALYPAIIAGGSVEIIPDDVRLDISKMNSHFIDRGVTHTFLTTQVGKMFVSSVRDTSLKVLTVGGEKLGEVSVPKGYRLYDGYGPTENTVFTSVADVAERISSSSVGMPNSNVKCYILDREGRRVPYGAVGELYVSGYQLSSGYVNRDDLNSSSFVENRFVPGNDANDRHSKLYATGDFFRFLPDGTLGVIGRRDGQIKIRGNRVELNEVESVIRTIPNIGDVTVQAVTDGDGGKELCAYVTAEVIDADQIRRFVAERKPAYMVPSYIVQLDRIPLNVNGKVDRRNLPKPDMSSSVRTYAAPRNAGEELLCRAFEEILGIDRVGIDDDFIVLGGDSLKAIRVQNAYGVSTTSDILRLRTPRAICGNTSSIDYRTDLFTIETGCPLSESQLNVYLDIVSGGKKGAYIIHFAYDMPPGIDISEARDAISSAMDAHPILCSHVEDRDDGPWIVCDRSKNICDAVSEIDIGRSLSSFCVSEGRIIGLISHIAFDGFSLSVLRETFDSIFKGEKVREETGFLVMSSFDRTIRESKRYSMAKAFYDSQFCDTDCDTGLMDDVGGESGTFAIDISTSSDDIRKFVSSNGVSLGTFFASAFAYTLSRFTGRNDAVFDILDNGRDLPGFGRAVGMFVRTIPVHLDCGNMPVHTFVRDSADVIYRSVSSAVYPFRLLHNEYGVNSEILFQFMADIETSSVDGNAGASAGDLDVFVAETGGGFSAVFEHSDRYSHATVERMATAFDSIIAGMLSCGELSQIGFVTDEDVAIQDRINQTECELEYGDILEAFREKVVSQPDSILVRCSDRTYTYAEADRITDWIAGAISDSHAGDNVAVLVPRSEWYLLGAIAVLKTGAAYVPIDDSYPDERIEHMLSDSSVRAVLTVRDVANRDILSGGRYDVVFIDECGPSEPVQREYKNLDDGVILYTSGSTGIPKGSAISRLAMLSFSEWYVRRFGFGKDDVYGMFSSFVFDAHIMALYPAIIAGGTVDIVPEDVRLDMRLLNERFIKSGVTHTFLTTQVGKMFVSSVRDTSLKVLTVGGEKLGEVSVPKGYRLYDGYGPTENTVFTSVADVAERISSSSVGMPNSNVKCYILDREGRRIPYGAVGELFVSGNQLSSRYVNNGAADDAAFRMNPFSVDGRYRRLYATGDFFRFLPDGSLGVIGRRDGQIKIRGNRVELNEVESVIRGMSSVADVTVQAVTNGSGGKELCAYVVSDDRSEDAVFNYVAESRPAYMVPSYVVFLDKIPLNVNGKVDRRLLPRPDTSLSKREYVAPRSFNEEMLCKAFAESLGLDRIGIDDDFILLGGDSVKAIRAQNISGVTTTANIIRYRTPRSISMHCSSDVYSSEYTLETGCPLSESQLNVYLDIVAKGKKGTYVIPFVYDVPAGSGNDVAKDAVSKALDAHPILVSRIEDRDGEPWIVSGGVRQISDSCPEESDVDVRRCLSVFSVTDGRIVGMISHIAFDGFSLSVLSRTFDDIFAGKDVKTETGFLRSSAFDAYVKGSKRYEEAKRFFDSQFCDIDCDSGLIADVAGRDGMHTVRFSSSAEAISEFVSENTISTSAFFASAFAYALSRFTGRSDAVFSILDNGRELQGIDGAVGMFVRTIPIHIDCSDRDTGRFVRESADTIYQSIESSVYPFRLLHKEYGLGSDILFQYMAGIETSSLRESDTVDASATSISDLLVNVMSADGGFVAELIHSSRYSQETVERIGDAFDMIVGGLVSQERLSSIRFTSDKDIKIQDGFNETDCELGYSDIVQAFREHVVSVPENLLVRYLDDAYTYAEADRITDGIACELARNGIGRGDKVALVVHRSEWYLLGALSVLKTGAAYVPIDDSYPDERISYIISDASARCALVTSVTAERVSSLFDGCIIDAASCADGRFEQRPIDRADDAVVLYTSGTTGNPKGSVVKHISLLNFVEWYRRDSGLTSSDVIGMFTTVSFDMHMMALYPTMIAGASVDIVPSDVRLDLDLLEEHFRRYGVTHTFITTQVGKLYASRKDRCVKVLHIAGEKCGHLDTEVGDDVTDDYGPTENLVSTSVRVNRRCDPSSVGFPISNVRGYILDRERRRVPFGAVGELFLSGYQLTSGYLNNAELNSMAFSENPFDGRKDWFGRIYATGDFVRYLPDGTFGIIGRRDGQVKIRGNRVELTEVEAAIRSMPSVRDATVQLIDGGEGRKELCAYVVSSDASHDAEEVIGHVASRKPSYMVPSHVVFLDSIPLNINGKVDRRALPKPDISSSRKEYAAPRNSREESVCRAFAETLGIDAIGIDDDFIALGGDSLKAIKVQNLSKVSSTADILRYRTPRSICEHAAGTDFDACTYTLETGCPLSESQLNVYLDIVANDKKGAYVLMFVYDIPDGTDTETAKRVISKVLDAHPILRSRIEKRGGVPWMVCDGMKNISDEEISGSDIDIQVSLSGFHISGRRIVGHISHIAFDGFSISVLTRTFDDIFSGKDTVTDTGFLLSSSFDESIKESERYAEAKAFYEARFCDADCDTGLIGDIGGREGSCSARLSVSAESIRDFVSLKGVSLGTFFASAFAYTLSRFTGRSDAVFCFVENGRDLPGLDRAVGMFVRTVPLRIDCSDADVADFVRDSASVIYGSMSSSIYPFRLLHSEYGLGSDILFQYMAGVEASSATIPGAGGSIGSSAAIGHLLADVRECDGYFVLETIHSSRYSDATVGRMVQAFDRIVEGLLSDRRLSDIEYVSVKDLAYQDSLNDNTQRFASRDIFVTYRAVLSATPDKIFVRHRERSYTYREIDTISNRIARDLVDSGIRKGDVVGILVPRSEWYIPAIIAVLKTGATYMPLDVDYADERLSFMMSDSGMKAVVVTPETRERAESLSSADIVIADQTAEDRFESAFMSLLDTMVILYTSGSTGEPKGCRIAYASVINVVMAYIGRTGFGADDTYGIYASIGFDAPLMGIFGAIYAGGTIDIIPGDIRLDIDRLNEYFVSHGVTHTFITTQLGKMFASRIKVSSLKVLTVGGEKFGDAIPDADYRIIDIYGPTETAVFVSCIDVRDRICPESVGYLNCNISGYILDKERRRVPVGAIGELHLSGYQLMWGYLNKEDIDEKVFFRNPFVGSEKAGFKWVYSTGDFFRILPDGTLGVIGRRDGQVKIRGNRVELTEVESAIRAMDAVSDAIVTAMTNGSGGKELCAYVVLKEQSSAIDANTIRAFVSGRKPAYMVPSHVLFLDSIPLNINGKVDRRALPKPDVTETTDYEAPRSEDERILCEAFAESLGIRDVGINSDFLALGGDSLKAVSAVSFFNGRSRRHSISPASLIRSRTPALIAADLKSKVAFDEGKYSYGTGCPLFGSQLSMYNFNSHTGMSVTIPEVITDDAWTSAEDVRDAVAELIRVHPVLCSRVGRGPDGRQWLFFGSKADIPIVAAEPKSFSSEFYRRFDIERDVLARFAVVAWEDRIFVFMDICHIVYDAYSSPVLEGDLRRIINGEEIPVDNGILKAAAYDESLRGSKEHMDAMQTMVGEIIDSGVSRSDGPIFVSGAVSKTIDCSGLDGCATQFSTSPGFLLSSIFAYAVCKAKKERKCSMTLIDSGRSDMDYSGSVGLFIKLVDVSVSGDTDDLSGFIASGLDSIYRFIDADIVPVWSMDDKDRFVARYMFDYVNVGKSKPSVDIETVRDNKLVNDLFALIHRDSDSLTINFIHSDAFDRGTVESILRHFIDGIETVIGRCDGK